MGTLLGKAQRYVNDVKAEVNRSMELDELKKMKETVETAARDVEQSVSSASLRAKCSAASDGGAACVADRALDPRPSGPRSSDRHRSRHQRLSS